MMLPKKDILIFFVAIAKKGVMLTGPWEETEEMASQIQARAKPGHERRHHVSLEVPCSRKGRPISKGGWRVRHTLICNYLLGWIGSLREQSSGDPVTRLSWATTLHSCGQVRIGKVSTGQERARRLMRASGLKPWTLVHSLGHVPESQLGQHFQARRLWLKISWAPSLCLNTNGQRTFPECVCVCVRTPTVTELSQ